MAPDSAHRNRVISRSIPADRRAPAAARRALEGLGGRIGDELKEDIRLLVSEVVTNSVLHGPSDRQAEVELDVWVSDDVVRVAVTDQGAGFEPQDRPTGGDRSGWGLMMVDRIADRWGVEVAGETEVWFEMRRAGESQACVGCGAGPGV
jgi:anti-sigma regulatory factor (Ser/Thr protein kinase)